MKFIWILLSFFYLLPHAFAQECLYVNSYHKGYAWSDAIESAVLKGLDGACHVTVFYMDTKRNNAASFAEHQALAAKALIQQLQPDVVLASDDNASKYLIAPYYKNADIPFVFSGINWTAKPYAYPYRNATGMIEVSAIKPLLRKAEEMMTTIKSVAFIGVKNVRTDEKEFAWMKKTYAQEGVKVVAFYAKSMKEWENAYIKAQKHDFIVLNNIAGIQGWDQQRAIAFAAKHANKLTVSTYDFMTPYTMFAMTKVAAEQGEWMVKLAKHVLQGKALQHVPLVHNRRWNMFVNPMMLEASSIKIPEYLMFKAVKVSL
ncbi:MAG: ABC transporter substrate binding protein [Ghiorsea sp.]